MKEKDRCKKQRFERELAERERKMMSIWERLGKANMRGGAGVKHWGLEGGWAC